MHRDLKPSNILIHNGTFKLGDFGFCKPLSEQRSDVTGTMLGSPIYMAPEVLRGLNYDEKADIWSLGCVLYELLIGRCPFEEKSIAKLITAQDTNDWLIPTEFHF
jgi:serine/threonine-protein kinase ULK/ATG1